MTDTLHKSLQLTPLRGAAELHRYTFFLPVITKVEGHLTLWISR